MCGRGERALYRARINSEGNSYNSGKQQECGEVRDGVVQAVRSFLMQFFCSADDEQGVWRHGAQEERSGGWSVQHYPGQHLLTLQVHTHFQLAQQFQTGKGVWMRGRVFLKKAQN